MKTATRKRKLSRKLAPRLDLAGMRDFFARQPDVVAAYLFGSVAKGTHRRNSDVDIAVLFDRQLDPSRRARLFLNMLGKLNGFADRTVDVRMLNDTNSLFRAQVVRHGQVVYQRTEGERIAFEVFTMADYADTKPMRDFFTQELYRRIREGRFGGRGRTRIHYSALETARRLYQATQQASSG